jgi:hypothetical protein
MWAGGLAGFGALVIKWGVGARGFLRLVAGLAVGLGAIAWTATPDGFVAAGTMVAAIPLLTARAQRPEVFLAVASLTFLASAWLGGGSVSVPTGAVVLGGVTMEMLLGHWFLVDPRLPREPLRRLDLLASIALVADFAVVGLLGALPWGPPQALQGWVFVGMTVTSLVLLTAVWFSLRQRGYSGVMAATGLSYLAVLTVAGAIVAGRSLIASSPFFS